MALNHQQIAERTKQIAAMKAAKKGKTPEAVAIVQAAPLAQIDPKLVYKKKQLFAILGVGEVTWRKWKNLGLRLIKVGKGLAVEGSDLIAVLKK